MKLEIFSSKIAGSTGVSPSGKAQGFDPCMRWFESSHPSQIPDNKTNKSNSPASIGKDCGK